MFDWPIRPFAEITSPFPIQEHLANLVRIRASVDEFLALPDSSADQDLFQYEHLRLVCLELHHLVVALESVCTAETCPEMKADEWLYLCAAHPQPQNCCAMDYTFHTLDGATSLLNSNKYFPSRMAIPNSSLKHFQSIARRLYRIFAHAWWHHRDVFEEFEVYFSMFILLGYIHYE